MNVCLCVQCDRDCDCDCVSMCACMRVFKYIIVQSINGWTPHAKPVHFTKTFNDPCPNYSSALLFLNKGAQLFELATDYNGPCMGYYSKIAS
jgi:hypothetical protein